MFGLIYPTFVSNLATFFYFKYPFNLYVRSRYLYLRLFFIRFRILPRKVRLPKWVLEIARIMETAARRGDSPDIIGNFVRPFLKGNTTTYGVAQINSERVVWPFEIDSRLELKTSYKTTCHGSDERSFETLLIYKNSFFFRYVIIYWNKTTIMFSKKYCFCFAVRFGSIDYILFPDKSTLVPT